MYCIDSRKYKARWRRKFETFRTCPPATLSGRIGTRSGLVNAWRTFGLVPAQDDWMGLLGDLGRGSGLGRDLVDVT